MPLTKETDQEDSLTLPSPEGRGLGGPSLALVASHLSLGGERFYEDDNVRGHFLSARIGGGDGLARHFQRGGRGRRGLDS